MSETSTTQTVKLYCFDREIGGDPHAVILDLSREDSEAFDRQKEDEYRDLGRYEVGRYIDVTDQSTGRRWRVASAPCGLGCHCAAVAQPVCDEHTALEVLRAEGIRADLYHSGGGVMVCEVELPDPQRVWVTGAELGDGDLFAVGLYADEDDTGDVFTCDAAHLAENVRRLIGS